MEVCTYRKTVKVPVHRLIKGNWWLSRRTRMSVRSQWQTGHGPVRSRFGTFWPEPEHGPQGLVGDISNPDLNLEVQVQQVRS